MDSPEDIIRYYKKQYRIYDATRSLFLFGRNELAKMINHNLNDSDNVLEVGCGTGYLLKKINSNQRSGIDLSPQMLNIAERNLNTSVELKQTSLLEFEPKQKYDNILLSYFFTISLNEMEKHIRKLRTLLTDGGSIYVLDFHRYGNELYKNYMNWHGIDIDSSLSEALQDNFETIRFTTHKAYLGIWEYFIYQGKYNA